MAVYIYSFLGDYANAIAAYDIKNNYYVINFTFYQVLTSYVFQVSNI